MKDWAWEVETSGEPLLLNLRYRNEPDVLSDLFAELAGLSPKYYRWYEPGLAGHAAFLHRLGGQRLVHWYHRSLPPPARRTEPNAHVELFYVTFTPEFCQFGRSSGSFVPVADDGSILEKLLSGDLELHEWSVQDGDYATIFARGTDGSTLKRYLAG